MTAAPSSPTTAEILMDKRERIKLQRIEGDRNRVVEQDALVLWFDATKLEPVAASAAESVFRRALQRRYTGVVLRPDQLATIATVIPTRMQLVVHCETAAEVEGVIAGPARARLIVAASIAELLAPATAAGVPTCIRAYVDDGDSLHAAIARGSRHSFLMIRFRDPTNIPLELVIASLQATATVLIKEIAAHDVEDALVTLGVMEVGADGVMYSPSDHAHLDLVLAGLDAQDAPATAISTGTVIRAVPVGMGYRSCIDLCTLFSPTEGMLIGSTSQGGILCCPEVFFLPYMELRPFRVNAGAVHSYVYNTDNRTDYMTELRGGSSVMISDIHGRVRRAPVGRMKTEIRPLRLIEVEFAGGERVNAIMQDDWHVRIFSADGKPLNITELRPGDRVLGHVAQPGRHVGIKVDEHIVES
jgi:3-amino-4-hydroxybenzoic acid synthase